MTAKIISSGLGLVVGCWLIKRLLERKSAQDKMVELGLDIGKAISSLIVAKFRAFEDKLENIIILIIEKLAIPLLRAIPVGLRENNKKKQKVREIKVAGKQRIDLIKHQEISTSPKIEKYIKKMEIKGEKIMIKKKVFDVMKQSWVEK